MDLERLKQIMKGKKILLVGLKGSGKGNRAQDLKALGLLHIGLGMIMREQVRKDPDSELSKQIIETTEQGTLLSDEVVIPVVLNRLSQRDCLESGFILDGFPRTRAQAELVLDKIDLDLVLYLDVPKAFLIDGVVRYNRQACIKCAACFSDFDMPKVEGVCDKCGGKLERRKSDTLELIQKRIQSDEEQINSFRSLFEDKGIWSALPITVEGDAVIDDTLLKKLKGEVYWAETDDGGKARLLNYDGMRERVYEFLEKKFA